jgi:hypothetical protein
MDPWSAAALGSIATGLFNQRSANKQMRFQDAQSRTQYQRAVADMKRAGLNPMLATKLGGNAAMSGASASMPDLGSTINSAQSIAQDAPVKEAQAEQIRLANDITKAINKPKAEIEGAPYRFVSDLVRDIESYVSIAKASRPVEIFTGDEVEALASSLVNLSRKSRRAFAATIKGLDATTTKVFEGFEELKAVIDMVR